MKHTITKGNLSPYSYQPQQIKVKIHESRDIQYGYTVGFTISRAITGNCQLSVIGNADRLLDINLRYKQDRKGLFNLLRKETSYQILLDVKTILIPSFITLFKPYADVNIKTNYISTNGSEMTIIIFKWKSNPLKIE